MKRQVIFEEEQLYDIINESAKRALRELMTESWGGDFRRWFDSDYMDDYLEEYGNGENEGMLQQLGAETIGKLAKSNPEAFQYIAQDPIMLARIAGNPGVVDQMTADPSFMNRLATDPSVQTAFMMNDPSQTVGFYGNENMMRMMNDPNIDYYTKAQLMSGGPVDPMMMQNLMTQYQTQNAGNDNGGWGGMISRLLGIPQQPPQYTDDQAQMFLQGISDVDQQINQYQQMLKANPNDISAKQNLELLQRQKAFYQPFVQNYGQQVNNDLQKLMGQIQNGQVPLNPQTMMQMQALQRKAMDLNTGYGQYLQQTPGQTSGKTQANSGGTMWDKITNMFQGAAGANRATNPLAATAQSAKMGTQAQPAQAAAQGGRHRGRQQAQPQQTPAATTRRQSRPAAPVTPAATPATPAAGNTPTVAAPTTPTPQAQERPTSVLTPGPVPQPMRGMNPPQQQPVQQQPKNKWQNNPAFQGVRQQVGNMLNPMNMNNPLAQFQQQRR